MENKLMRSLNTRETQEPPSSIRNAKNANRKFFVYVLRNQIFAVEPKDIPLSSSDSMQMFNTANRGFRVGGTRHARNLPTLEYIYWLIYLHVILFAFYIFDDLLGRYFCQPPFVPP